ncbi:hypothetical protein DYB25_013240, partial [Aphanomyces astaci]
TLVQGDEDEFDEDDDGDDDEVEKDVMDDRGESSADEAPLALSKRNASTRTIKRPRKLADAAEEEDDQPLMKPVGPPPAKRRPKAGTVDDDDDVCTLCNRRASSAMPFVSPGVVVNKKPVPVHQACLPSSSKPAPAIQKAKATACAKCHLKGASIPCLSCRHVFHVHCAAADKGAFDDSHEFTYSDQAKAAN